jgi:hypothetical protein
MNVDGDDDEDLETDPDALPGQTAPPKPATLSTHPTPALGQASVRVRQDGSVARGSSQGGGVTALSRPHQRAVRLVVSCLEELRWLHTREVGGVGAAQQALCFGGVACYWCCR